MLRIIKITLLSLTMWKNNQRKLL